MSKPRGLITIISLWLNPDCIEESAVTAFDDYGPMVTWEYVEAWEFLGDILNAPWAEDCEYLVFSSLDPDDNRDPTPVGRDFMEDFWESRRYGKLHPRAFRHWPQINAENPDVLRNILSTAFEWVSTRELSPGHIRHMVKVKRKERVAALGNAVVPQVVATIGAAILLADEILSSSTITAVE